MISLDTNTYLISLSEKIKEPKKPTNGSYADSENQPFFIKKDGWDFFLIATAPQAMVKVNGQQISKCKIQNNDIIETPNNRFLFITPHIPETSIVFTNPTYQIDLTENLSEDITSLQDFVTKAPTCGLSQKAVVSLEKITRCKNIFDAFAECTDFLNDVANEIYESVLFTSQDNVRSVFPLISRSVENTSKSLSQNQIEKSWHSMQANTGLVSDYYTYAIPFLHLNKTSHVIWFSSVKKINRDQTNSILIYCNLISSHLNALKFELESEQMLLDFTHGLSKIIEAKDTYTIGHSQRVAIIALKIGQHLHLDKTTLHNLRLSALLHDIGKIAIPDSILKKSSFLTREEFEIMRHHPVLGAEIMSDIPSYTCLIPGILHHHEKWDGTGYPNGLSGEKIPLFARIIAIADSYDAMISGRSYSGFFNENDAVESLSQSKGIYDQFILKAFTETWEQGKIVLPSSTR